jgi:DNA-binding MarR family transcriptional regulator
MSVKPDVVALRTRGRALGTRALGAELAAELRQRISDASGTVLVDFDGVEVASSPVLDEIACALRAAISDNPGRLVVLTALNEDVRDTLSLVLQRREMMLATLQDRQLQLVGGRKHLEETLAEAQELGQFTAAQLADRLELKLPNLHQRLVQLQAAGAVRRVESPARQRAMVFATPNPDELTAA